MGDAMKQTLHIFRKDVRFLWLPTLMVLALTVVFASSQPANSEQAEAMGPGVLAPGAAGFFLLLAWWYLITAAIYKERPTGDRQFWVTRPYSWKSLVGAKVLLIVTFISMPFLISDVAILAARGLPVSAGGLIWRQVVVGSVYLLPMAALASVTRYYAQIAITLVAGLVVFVFATWRAGGESGLWGPLEWIPASIIGALLFIAGLGVLSWQYAERRTWAGRGVLIVTVGLCLAMPRIQPFSAAVALVSSGSGPVDLRAFHGRSEFRSGRPDEGVRRAEVLTVVMEGLPAQMRAAPDLVRVTIPGARGNRWDSGWRPESPPFLSSNLARL
jgi:hypothetical protein